MDQGRLRDAVRVSAVGEEVIVQHRFLELALPRAWVDETPEIQAILVREIGVDALVSQDKQVNGVVEFLKLQDCFFHSRAKAEYSLREIREIFEPIALDWYARYYNHPLWNRLRRGELNLNGFVAWVLHNYHVSRAAGKSSARCAVVFPKRELRKFFRADVLEEYWHCDSFYFVYHPALAITDAELKNCVPLPASLAFEQHTTTLAETDWLAYLLVSYFQESSIQFYADCQDFYREVESAYQLPGFFKSWTAHIRLDFDHGHADNFTEILSSSDTVSHEHFARSLAAAWFAFSFLYSALDQVESEAAKHSAVTLRNPIRGWTLDPATNSLCQVAGKPQGTNLFELANDFVSVHRSHLPETERAVFLTNGLVEALYYSMSVANEHDEIIVLGQLIEAFPAVAKLAPERDISVAAIAIVNFLRAQAIRPRLLLFMLQLAINLGCKWTMPEMGGCTRLEEFMKAIPAVGDCCSDRLATSALQWSELLNWEASGSDSCPSAFEI
jgi:thiaminase